MRLYASAEGKAHETTERLGLHRLVRQISDLQSKNTELYQRALTSEHRVSEQEAEVAALKDSVSTLNSERNELQDDLIKMRSSKVRPCLSHITIEIKVCARRCDLIITHCCKVSSHCFNYNKLHSLRHQHCSFIVHPLQ